MSIIQSAAPDYSSDDFTSLRARLIALLSSALPNLDLDSLAELATLLLEGQAWTGDVSSYYLRLIGREARITTATQRRGLLGAVKLIGFQVPGATAAQAQETFNIAPGLTGVLLLPAGTIVSTTSTVTPIKYQLLADLVINPGTLTVTATVENSLFESDAFNSTGAPNQSFTLSQTPYIDSSLIITDAVETAAYDPALNPTGWRQVTNFLTSLPTDHVYTVSVDNLDRALVTFGNGVTGAIPSGAINFKYKVGGGSAGSVTAGALTVLSQSFSDANGNAASITVNNVAASSPGADRFSVQQIQQLAPASLAVQGRSVANSDFETVANLVPGVLRTLFLTAIEDPSVPFNEGMGFVVPVGGGQPSALLLQQVAAQFQQIVGYPAPPYPKPNAFPVQWLGVPYLPINVNALLYLQTGAQPNVVGAAVRAALAAYLAPSNADGSINPSIDFGYKLQDQNGNPTGTFAWSKLFDLVASVAGIAKIDPGPAGFLLNGARADVVLATKQFPQLGSVSLVNAIGGQAF